MTKELILMRWWKSFWPKNFEASLVWLSIFLLPWQLRHTVYFANYGGNYYEYPSIHIYATDILMAVLVGWWLVRGGRNRVAPKLVWLPIVLWLVWMTLAGNLGIDAQNSLQQSLHYWLCLGWLLYLVNNIKNVGEIVWPLVWGAGFQAIWGAGQFLLNRDLGMQILGESPLGPNQGGVMVVGDALHRQIRAYGLLPHPNMLAGILATAIVPLVWLYQAVKKHRGIVLALALVTTVGLGLAFSRMSWVLVLGLVLVCVIWMILNKPMRVSGAIVGVVVLSAIVVGWWQWPNIVGRFDLSSQLEQKSVNERIVGWRDWPKVASGHWLAGVGVGNYAQRMIELNPNQLVWTYKPVHNIYVLMVTEVGAVGLGLWLWLIGAGVWLWVRLVREDINQWWMGAPLMTVVGLGMTDHWLVSFQQGRMLTFLALALIIFASKGIVKAINR